MEKKIMAKVKKDIGYAVDARLITRNAANYLFRLFTHELADSVSYDWEDMVNGEAGYTLIYVTEEWEDVSGDYEPEQRFEEHFLYEDEFFSYYHGKCYLDDENTIVGNELMDLEDYWYCWHTVVPKANAVNVPELTKTTTSPKQMGDTNTDYQGKKENKMKELIVSVAGVWDGSKATYAYTANEWKDGEDMGCVSIARGEAPASAQHIGAELKAVMAAVLWGKQNGYTSFTFYHSYEGVEKWVTGEWKANKQLPQAYRDWMQKQQDGGLMFYFSRDKAQSNISFAHQLANVSIKEVMRARK